MYDNIENEANVQPRAPLSSPWYYAVDPVVIAENLGVIEINE